ncbi:helix-hairpin-helix domain-containing protein [Xanthomonas sp. XNM01]|uniref:helix-hairpin-helix domain-containing protein n=1 Tax=Xanthomonas sp. XNM01 TaxID=2769289 RepID=UPI00177F34E3|nr:helix-hairpin-helix domain-containing protein [Xanthomonas sp. XNM01]MBD9367486.1 helix-hairpin-helix domain-containing protein [Xanthomonas sp. XNM01]
MAEGFSAAERDALLATRGVGPTVIARLEQIGYRSLAQLADASVEDITGQVAAMLGTTCWRNSPQSRAAIAGAIAAAQAAVAPAA